MTIRLKRENEAGGSVWCTTQPHLLEYQFEPLAGYTRVKHLIPVAKESQLTPPPQPPEIVTTGGNHQRATQTNSIKIYGIIKQLFRHACWSVQHIRSTKTSFPTQTWASALTIQPYKANCMHLHSQAPLAKEFEFRDGYFPLKNPAVPPEVQL